jgi:hypothetical protein
MFFALFAAAALAAPQQPDTTVTVERGQRLSVEVHAGSITVRTWDRSAVRIRATNMGVRGNLEVDADGSSVDVEVTGRNGTPTTADVEVTMPAWMPVSLPGHIPRTAIRGLRWLPDSSIIFFGEGGLVGRIAQNGAANIWRVPDTEITFLGAHAEPSGVTLVGERPYRLDRMVTQLQQAGLLARARAVVIGELPRCDEPSGETTARAVMAEVFSDFPGPVLIGFPSGHTVGPAMTLPFGVACTVIANGTPRVVIEEAAVE